MPAQKKRLKRYRKKNKNKSFKKIYLSILLLLGLFLLGFYIFSKSTFKNKYARISVAFYKEDKNILISTFDSTNDSITNVIIPGNTEVEVARQLGKMKLMNVRQLGINEGCGGLLLTETISKFFKFPVYLWAEDTGGGLSTSNLPALINSVFVPYKTNLSLGDKIKLAIFSIQVSNSKRSDLSLTDTDYLKKQRLIGGEEGYVLTGRYPTEYIAIYSDPFMSNENTKVIIKDATGNTNVAEELGEIIEIIGAKVVSIDNIDEEIYDCGVQGKSQIITSRIAQQFSCKILTKHLEGNIDLEIRIGKQFADRF